MMGGVKPESLVHQGFSGDGRVRKRNQQHRRIGQRIDVGSGMIEGLDFAQAMEF